MTIPIPFIIVKNGVYSISQEAEQFFNQLEDQAISIISVVGKYRTGKSFFINNVLINQSQNGFKVGNTINACTKGVWIWPELIQNPQNPNQKILVMDTEGFGGTDENLNHDSKITLLALLLSSFFIYNGVGQIDESALQNLNLVISLAKDLQVKKGMQEEIFPQLLWVLRDFSLQLVDQYGKDITTKQYLQNSLDDLKGISDVVEQKNKIRRMIKHFFKERDCITIVRPTEDEKNLQNLEKMKISQFRQEFLNDIQRAKERIFNKVQDKVFNNRKVTVSNILFMAQQYVEALNQGVLPNIEYTWTMVQKNSSVQASKQCIDFIENELKNKQFSKQEFELKKIKLLNSVEKMFKQKIIGEFQDYQDIYNQMLDKIEKIFVQNYEKIHLKIQKEMNIILNQNFSCVLDKLNQNQIDSFDNFEKTINQFLNEQQSKQLDELIIAQNQLECYKKGFKQFWEQSIYQQQSIIKKYENELKKKDQEIKDNLEIKINQLLKRQNEQEMQFKQNEQRLEQEIQYLQKENDFLINQYKNADSGLKKANSNLQFDQNFNSINLYKNNDNQELLQKNQQLENKIKSLQEKNLQAQKEQSKLIYEIENLKQKMIDDKSQIQQSQNIQQKLNDDKNLIQQNIQSESKYTSQPISSLDFIKQSTTIGQKPVRATHDQNIVKSVFPENHESIIQKKKEKIKQLKKYKEKIEQNSSSIQCMHCNNQLSLAMFFYHLDKCISQSEQQNPQSRQYSSYSNTDLVSETQKTERKFSNYSVQLKPQSAQQIVQQMKFLKTPTQNQIPKQKLLVNSIQSVRKQKRPNSINENQQMISKFH